MSEHAPRSGNRGIESARALFYDFFAGLFLYDLLKEREELIANQLGILAQNPLEEGLEVPLLEILQIMKSEGIGAFLSEYTNLFIMPFSHRRLHLLLSHYKEGCVGGRALLDIRQRLRDFPVRMNSELCKESEEHIGFLMMLMRFLVEHQGEVPEGSEKRLFAEFIKPYIFTLASELMHHSEARIYSKVGAILRSFMEFEQEFLE